MRGIAGAMHCDPAAGTAGMRMGLEEAFGVILGLPSRRAFKERLMEKATKAALGGCSCCGGRGWDPLLEVQEAVSAVGAGSVGDAVRTLRGFGPEGEAVGRRLQRASRACNAAAHPDARLAIDAWS